MYLCLPLPSITQVWHLLKAQGMLVNETLTSMRAGAAACPLLWAILGIMPACGGAQ